MLQPKQRRGIEREIKIKFYLFFWLKKKKKQQNTEKVPIVDCLNTN